MRGFLLNFANEVKINWEVLVTRAYSEQYSSKNSNKMVNSRRAFVPGFETWLLKKWRQIVFRQVIIVYRSLNDIQCSLSSLLE